MTVIRPILFLFLYLGSISLAAQNISGEITYKRTSYWIKIMEELPFLSQAEKDRANLTWGSDDGYSSNYILRFTADESSYTHDETAATSDDNSWAWRKDDYLIYRDLKNRRRTDWLEMLDRTYLVEDDLQFPKWKILSEIKDIQGYVCMSAETRDTIKNQHIVAWFTDEIPVPVGPEMFGGLPGAILELEVNGGSLVVTASNVDLKPMPDGVNLPKKMKGKKIDLAKYQDLIETYLKDSVGAERNPYWSIRY
ncbi:MAG: GLPGLI family protein [Saprospiraceae bacterium]|nr:GLPGLI family protein [Saprospiraceae bacterium]